MKKTNSASRILNLLRVAASHDGSERIHEVWSNVFDIVETDTNKRNLEISRCLQLMLDEIESVRRDMDFTAEDEFECEDILEGINTLLAVHLLQNEWKTLHANLTTTLFLCLGYCRQVLPDEEKLIDESEIEEIREIIEILKSQLDDSILPKHTQRIIRGHISSIEKSLHNYKISGVDSLQGTMNSIVGEIFSKEEVFKDAKGAEEISTLGKLIQKYHSVSERVVKTEKLLSSGQKIAQHGSKAIEFIDGLI